MNYKKSILSLAAVLALSSSVIADPNATYLPLTNETNDNAWIMFGVNDFSTGIPSAETGDGDFTAGYSTVTEDDTTDDLVSPNDVTIAANAVDTIFRASDDTHNMATFQALKDSNGKALINEALKIGLKTSDLVYSETQPVRSMYIALQTSANDTNTVAKVKLNYKATLEGRTIEIQLGGEGAILKATISESATFNNPAIAKERVEVLDEKDEMAPEDVLAYDLTASPILASAFDKTKHKGTTAGAERFYHYDAANAQWILWDRAKVSNSTNTLTKFQRGRAYWGRMDISGSTGDSNSATSDTKAGLYLGKTGLAEASSDRYTGKLTPASWNMVAFDPASHPDIRNAATGLVVNAADAANGDIITITDETGTNAVAITLATAVDGATEEIAVQINKTIEAAKISGKVPDTFSVKAFAADDADTLIIFISDKQFTITDDQGAGECLTTAKTIANVDSVINFDGTNAQVLDIQDGTTQAKTGATSVYGEYAMIIEPLVGAGTASDLDFSNTGTSGDGAGGAASVGSAYVQFGNIDGDSSSKQLLAADDTTTTVGSAQAIFDADEVFDDTKSTGQVIEIDTDFDGATDMLLAAADKPFYIKDNTFTRVYDLDVGADGTATGGVSFNISPADKTVTPAAADLIGDVETDINDLTDNVAVGDATEVYASSVGNKLVVITKKSKVFELEDADSATIDYFSATSLNNDIAKGAVKRIVNIAELAREKVITNKFDIDFFADASGVDDGGGNNAIVINGNAAADTVIAAATDTDTKRIAMLDSLVDEANVVLKANDIAGFASHNYVDGTDNINKATITIEGVGIDTVTMTNDDAALEVENGADASAGAGNDGTGDEQHVNNDKIDIDGALIVSNLKANAVYTPDYVNNGPLYTLKSAGYEAKAIIRASTKLANTPTTHWDHIDLTRDSKDWLKNNEYNLFNIYNHAGYWVYVDAYAPQDDISNGTVVWTPSFAHHFNTKTGSTENLLNAASFSVEIADMSAEGQVLDEETSNAKLIISGNEVQLTKTGTTFSAVLTEPETVGLTPNSGPLAIGLKAADGLGESYTNSALITFDYDQPDAPKVAFADAANVAFTSDSADVASYYIWKDYIPDDGNSLTPVEKQLLAADAAAYNICPKSDFGAESKYKVVAFDGTGVFGKANASDITAFTYVNTIKGATMLTHSKDMATSTVVSYDATTCLADATPAKSGVEAKAIQAEGIVLSYIPIEGVSDSRDDLPYSAFYKIDGGADVVQVDVLKAYASRPFYLEYNGALYTSNFPATQAAADASFSDAIVLTEVTSANKSLDDK